MNKEYNITTLFLDIGGVLLTDGWNRRSRKAAAEKFNLELGDMEDRHHLTFDTYEVGKISLDEYLQRVVFFKDRNYTSFEFKEFMYAQSAPFPEMIQAISGLKKQYGLKVAVVSNEGRELTEYRIKKFKLYEFVDFFVSSCFVHLRKPDVDIFQAALDISQIPAAEVVYIEDRPMFVQVAEGVGINGVHHTDYQSTLLKLAEYGLK
jgi:putative hydrolase of the HAD superfamily